MKWSQGYIYTLKESPSDAEIPSHKLLVRGGYIRKLAQGIFTYGPLALRSIRKFEEIVRQELERRGCVEILMPMVQPKEVWQETGRWDLWGDDLCKFVDRGGREFCLGPTHEEVVTDFVRKDIKSYRDLPVTLFQIQTKFRNEIRPRFGLMRGREFIMKDAYSFDLDREQAQKSYDRMYEAYSAIFERLGLDYRVVEADTGAIGGSLSHEFHVLAESGEDELMVSEESDFAANVEVCPAIEASPFSAEEVELRQVEEFDTPGLKTIADLSSALGVEPQNLVKTMFYWQSQFSASHITSTDKTDELKAPVAVLVRGSDEVNPLKLKKVLGMTHEPEMLNDQDIKKLTGAWPGSCGPVGLKIPIYMDQGVSGLRNMIVGANKDEKHFKNVNADRDFKVEKVADLRRAKAGDKDPRGSGLLKSVRGIEVGHIFYLGTKYSEAMKAEYLDSEGHLYPAEMGCYGIGVTRTVQAAVEQNHDDDGIIWPKPLAPYHVHICLLDPKDEKVSAVANDVYDRLWNLGIECLMDDRDERPGIKFKDADLLGMPLRLTMGRRGLSQGVVELRSRKEKVNRDVELGSVVKEIQDWLNSAPGEDGNV